MRYSPEDYEREVSRFEWDIPAGYNIVDVVAGHAEGNPDKVAIFWEDAAGNTRRLTFGALIDGARRFGSALVRLGVKKGDPILHLLPRIPEAPIVQLGTFIAGAVAVPCSEMLKAKEISHRAQRSGAKVVIADVPTAIEAEIAREASPVSTHILIGGRTGGVAFFRGSRFRRFSGAASGHTLCAGSDGDHLLLREQRGTPNRSSTSTAGCTATIAQPHATGGMRAKTTSSGRRLPPAGPSGTGARWEQG